MRSVRTPRFLDNLYRDMRDRRLLFPALALLVALIAVPVLLKDGSSTPSVPPVSASSVDGSGPSATEPAVLAENAGITDYHKRLGWLHSKNPFRSRAPVPTSDGGQGSSSGASGSSTTSSPLGTVTATGTGSASSFSASGTASSTTSTSSPPASGGGSSTSGSQNPPQRKWYSFRVSVAVGPAGNLTEHEGVKRLEFLPGDNRPLVAFIGVTEDAKHAIFAVSDDVSSVRGDGTCLPRRGSCDFLELKPGDKASLRYEPEGNRTYNLKLRKIELVPVGKPHASTSGKLGSEAMLGPDG
jgi:hypothetical protein